jgi:hypothetical protein
MADAQSTQLFCLADPLYYETPDRVPDRSSRFALSEAAPPPGWRRSQRGLWTGLSPLGPGSPGGPGSPPAGQLPAQGWKIHLSTLPDEAGKTLEDAAAVCLRHGAAFKFLRSRRAVQLAADKYMSRASSGKFLTVYPRDERQLAVLLEELTGLLDGRPGPYILSDLRIGPGPVHVRYGAFTAQWCPGPDGTPVPALRDPSGALVPDRRGPVFQLPDWVRVPDPVAPHLAARDSARTDDFPYVIRQALHFTNAGGIYRAEHRGTGEQVVLREARPHSGLDGAGDDAVVRLHREHRALARLAGLGCVPRLHAVRQVWEHHYLIEEHIEGHRLLDAMVGRFPLVRAQVSDAELRGYLDWAEEIIAKVSRALDAVHARGLSFGDLHPGNIMLRPDGSVALVDFEYATAADAIRERAPGAAGFAGRPGTTGAEADRHALRALWLMMLLPMAELTELEPAKAATFEAVARRRYRLPPEAGPAVPADGAPADGAAEARVRELFGAGGAAPGDGTGDGAGDGEREPDWPRIRELLIRGIHAGADPARTDRLFPGDPEVFTTGGHTLAHGAAGVLLALHHAGEPVPREYTDWLAAAARRAGPGHHRGLFDGLWGAAGVLHDLGRTEQAVELVESARRARPPVRAGLYGGTAGTALARLRFAKITGDDTLLTEAVAAAERLADLPDLPDLPDLSDHAAGSAGLPPTAGLFPGLSGAALLQLRLYRITGEEHRLAAARRALRWETGHCVTMPDGTLQKRSGHRHLLYLHEGSGGIALVAREYLTLAEDAELAAFTAAVLPGCAPEFVREPGLFHGRAGIAAMLHQLSAPGAPSGTATPDAAVTRELLSGQLRRMAWYALLRDEGLLIPGGRLRRCSADLATGAAGVLLALRTVLEPGGPGLLGALVPE